MEYDWHDQGDIHLCYPAGKKCPCLGIVREQDDIVMCYAQIVLGSEMTKALSSLEEGKKWVEETHGYIGEGE